MNICRLMAALAIGMAAATPTFADPVNLNKASGGDTYFNRPGATMAVHDSELLDCMFVASHAINFEEGHPGLIGFGMSSKLTKMGIPPNTENCMVVRGWRVVRLPHDEAEAIRKLDQPGQAAALSPWVGAAEPHGEIVRRWGNDAALSDTSKLEDIPTGGASLSFGARAKSSETDPKLFQKYTDDIYKGKGLVKEIKLADLQKVSPDIAVIVFWGKDKNYFDPKKRATLGVDELFFDRMGTDPETSPSDADKFPAELSESPNFVWHSKGEWTAFAVAPGRWRLAAFGDGLGLQLNFCLGSPEFEVKAGEVVFAGAMDLSDGVFAPNMDLAPVKDWLGGSTAAAKVRTAEYVNGSTGHCSGSYFYAFELAGRPFVDGYAWGSRASATALPARDAPAPPPAAVAQSNGAIAP